MDYKLGLELRLKALIIDFVIVFAAHIPFLILFIRNQESLLFQVLYSLSQLLFFFKDSYKGQSLGRKIMKIRVVTIDDKVPSLLTIISRTLISLFTVPFDLLLISKSKVRIVDRMFSTKVIIEV